MAQLVKNLPAMQETPVKSLGQEDFLEKEMATHCSILTWEIPWIEEPGRLQSMGSERVGHNLVTKQCYKIYNRNAIKILKENSHPLMRWALFHRGV